MIKKENDMNNKWLIGIAVGIVIIVALFGTQSTWLMGNRYGMMNGYNWNNMPMMYNGMMGTGMVFAWLVGLAFFIFLVLAIVWLVRELTTKKS